MTGKVQVGDKLVWRKIGSRSLLDAKIVMVSKIYKDNSFAVAELPTGENRFKNGWTWFSGYGKTSGCCEWPKEGETDESLAAEVVAKVAAAKEEKAAKEKAANDAYQARLDEVRAANLPIAILDVGYDWLKTAVLVDRQGNRSRAIFAVSTARYYDFEANIKVNGFELEVVTYGKDRYVGRARFCGHSPVKGKTVEEALLQLAYDNW